jgi:hypothetical protein
LADSELRIVGCCGFITNRPGLVRRSAIRSVATLILALALIAGWLPGGLELVISPKGGGAPLLTAPLEPGERFTLRYIHSVDRTPIWEEHSVDRGGSIYIEQERFVMFGAGMGHWQGHGTLTSRGRYQVIENIHEPVGKFVLRVGGEEVDHTIIWRGARIHLSHLAAGRPVVVAARPVSLLQRLWRRPVGLVDWKESE